MGKIWSSDDEIIKMLFNKLEKNSKKEKETFETLFLTVFIYNFLPDTAPLHGIYKYSEILKPTDYIPLQKQNDLLKDCFDDEHKLLEYYFQNDLSA